MTKAAIRLLLSLALLLSGTACKKAGGPVRIGIVNSVTGPEAPIGELLTNGYLLAQEDLKKEGIEAAFITEDDTGKPQVAMSALEKLATRDNVAGVVGPYPSSSANAIAKLAERYKLPLLVPAASKEEITRQDYQWVYRLNAPTSIYSQVILDAVMKLGSPKTIALIYENTDFGTSAGATARAYAPKKGLTVVAEEPYSKGSPDYRSMLTQVKAKSPDLVFMVSYVADAILLMRQAREVGLSPQAFLGAGAGFTTDQFAAEKDVSEGVLASTQWTDDAGWPGSKEWAARYKARFGKEPTYHAACGYESLRIMGESVAKAKGDHERTRLALKDGAWDGIMGRVKFENYDGYQNQNNHAMLVQQIHGGKFMTVFPEQFAAGKATYPFPGWK
jgi:branched-chain amino acid transport system substrate-binding protein